MTMKQYVIGRIIELCEERGLGLNKLADLSNLPATTVKNIVYGHSKNPGVVTLNNICQGLGITLLEFFDTPAFRLVQAEPQRKKHE